MQDLPIGMSEFTELRKKNCVYVDKTKYVYSLLKKNTRTFLARPRRFGKSLLVSTLDAALQGKRELFEDLWIANSDYSWEPVGVIRFDFSELSTESLKDFKQDLLVAIQGIARKYNIELDTNLTVNSSLKILIETLCPIKNKRPKTTTKPSSSVEVPSVDGKSTLTLCCITHNPAPSSCSGTSQNFSFCS